MLPTKANREYSEAAVTWTMKLTSGPDILSSAPQRALAPRSPNTDSSIVGYILPGAAVSAIRGDVRVVSLLSCLQGSMKNQMRRLARLDENFLSCRSSLLEWHIHRAQK